MDKATAILLIAFFAVNGVFWTAIYIEDRRIRRGRSRRSPED